MRHLNVFAILVALAAAAPGRAQDLPHSVLDPGSFQSFVRNWTPASQPLCAVLQSQADWDEVMAPAPTMGRTKPFAPPAGIWSRSAVLLVARVIDAGDLTETMRLQRVRQAAETVEIVYGFTPPPGASSTVKWWLGVKVDKPLPRTIRFVEDGRIICTLEPASGVWRKIGAS